MHEILCSEAFDDNVLAQTTRCISHGPIYIDLSS